MRQREVERFRGCLDERLCTVQCRLQHVKCLSCQPGTTSIWTHHTEASNFLGLGEIKDPDPKWNQNKGGWGSYPYLGILRLILTPEPDITHPVRTWNWQLYSVSTLLDIHVRDYLTSWSTINQSINQSINEQINEWINQWIDQWIN